ncbi:MAG: nucleoside recognition domain-containing protein [Bacillota bacterium]
MPFLEILVEALKGSLSTIWKIAVFVIPLMVLMEFLKEANLIDRLADITAPFARVLGMSKEASMPLMVGLIFGLTYGAGLIIQAAREGKMTKKDLYLLNAFLVVCHAIFEDTAVFAAIGAHALIMFIVRLGLAVIVTLILARYWRGSEQALGSLGKIKPLSS